MSGADQRGPRLLAAAHLGQAVVLLAPPSNLQRRIAGAGGVPPSWIVRMLGARLLLQAVPEAVGPNRGVLRAGVLVDLAHAASMLAAAGAWPRYRRAALASAATAVASALAGTLLLRSRR